MTVDGQAMSINRSVCALWSMGLAIGPYLSSIVIATVPLGDQGVALLGIVFVMTQVLAFGLGVLSLGEISRSGGRVTGRGYAWIGIGVPFIGVVLGIIMPILSPRRSFAFRMTCGTNLSGMGKAMLVYANDNDNSLPMAGGHTNQWVDSLGGPKNATSWMADTLSEAYGFDSQNKKSGHVTTSASLYLLVKYAGVAPKSFVCRGESDTREFRLADWLDHGVTQNMKLVDVWDFGYFVSYEKNPSKHVSYSYQHPFGSRPLIVANEPRMAVMADRSPWLNPVVDKVKTWAIFRPDIDSHIVTAEQARMGNSLSHQREGQNVLFLDSHVSFEKRAYVGIENDNIYTMQYEDDPNSIALGKRPVPYDEIASQPRSRRDSVLLQEPGRGG